MGTRSNSLKFSAAVSTDAGGPEAGPGPGLRPTASRGVRTGYRNRNWIPAETISTSTVSSS